jgi:hypothetical protein
MANVLNTSFYLPFGQRGVAREAAEASVIQDLLCYDRVYVLTDQMEAVGRLAAIMGFDTFARVVDQEALCFVHDRQILGWPTIPGYLGPVPFVAFATWPSEKQSRGYSQIASSELAERVLAALQPEKRSLKKVCSKIERTTIDFGRVEKADRKTEDEADQKLLETLTVYEEAVAHIDGFPLRPTHFRKLRRDIANPRRSPIRIRKGQNKYRMVKIASKSGSALLDVEAELPRPQLAMLNLELSDRFLQIHGELGIAATLHTEPVVEQVLAARAAAVRQAAGGEVDIVLNAERVSLPVLRTQGPFPYAELLRARQSTSGKAFRKVVENRDADRSAVLLQEYLASLNKQLGDRFGVVLARFVLTTILGFLNPVVGTAGGALDSLGAGKLFARTNARYFVDTTLRRIALDANRSRSEDRAPSSAGP